MYVMPAITATAATASATADGRSLAAGCGRRCGRPRVPPELAADPRAEPGMQSAISIRASAISRRRRSRSLSRQRRSVRSTSAGSSGGRASQSGSSFNTAAMDSAGVAPGKARWAHKSSKSTHPNAQMSVLRSSVSPRTCSGLMYGTVPTNLPCSVIDSGSVAAAVPGDSPAGCHGLARPKSRIFTSPRAVTITFAGFRSRWMIPASCAPSSPSAICVAMWSARSTGSGPARTLSASVSPSMSSSARKQTSPSCSSAWMVAMRGWFNDASARASRCSRASCASSVERCAGSTLSAIARPNLVSSAR